MSTCLVNQTNRYLVRNARDTDCAQIVLLIKQLAVYEKMPNEVCIDADQLRFDGFGEGHPPRFHAVVCELLPSSTTASSIIAFSLFVEKYSTWKGRFLWIEDLYVSEQYRRFGLGEALLRKVVSRAAELQMPRVEWAVLSWNSLAISFYHKHGAIDLTKEEQWHVFRLKRDKYLDLLDKQQTNGAFIQME